MPSIPAVLRRPLRRRSALLSLTLLASALVLTQSAAVAQATPAPSGTVVFVGWLKDLTPAGTTSTSPFQHAFAIATGTVHGATTTVTLTVVGIDPKETGMTYGAHLHVGPCVAGDGAAAGGHYNVSALRGDNPVVVSNRTEVWLDFTVAEFGLAYSQTTVPFIPTAGQRSIVIHAMPTAANGTAGARLACLPVTG